MLPNTGGVRSTFMDMYLPYQRHHYCFQPSQLAKKVRFFDPKIDILDEKQDRFKPGSK